MPSASGGWTRSDHSARPPTGDCRRRARRRHVEPVRQVRRHSSGGSGWSVRRWQPRLSVRAVAAATSADADGEQVRRLARAASAGPTSVGLPATASASASAAAGEPFGVAQHADVARHRRRGSSARVVGSSEPRPCGVGVRPARPRSGSSQARSRPTRVPATTPSVRLFDASRLAPCTPVHGDLADGVEPGASSVRPSRSATHAAAGVVRGGRDRDPVAGRVDAGRAARRGDRREALVEALAHVGGVEVHVVVDPAGRLGHAAG